MSTFRSAGPQTRLLSDRRRLHLNHGPIDIILQAFGEAEEVAAAYWQAQQAFQSVLQGLVDELPVLRQPISPDGERPNGAIAQMMYAAAAPHAFSFITPMAAVAGAVADHILAAAVKGRRLDRAYANNGGDIALHLSDGQEFNIAVAADVEATTVRISCEDRIRGIATSGWGGRSHSLGIADSVTVLASSAATADAAATLIANAVDLPGSPKVTRDHACALSPESDLGDRLVTTEVAPLSDEEIDAALNRGVSHAEMMREHNLLVAAQICLQGAFRIVGNMALSASRPGLLSNQRPGFEGLDRTGLGYGGEHA